MKHVITIVIHVMLVMPIQTDIVESPIIFEAFQEEFFGSAVWYHAILIGANDLFCLHIFPLSLFIGWEVLFFSNHFKKIFS